MSGVADYCWVSITELPEAFNFGNRLIERALRSKLSLSGNELSVSAYRTLSQEQIAAINACRYVVLPGCTLIQPDEHPAMEQIKDVTPPVYCFGGAFFTRLALPRAKYCRNLQRPVGVRDPFAHRHLRLYGIPSKLIGCPTLFTGDADDWVRDPTGFVLFNFGRKNIGAQLEVFERVRREAPVKVVIQEESQRQYFPPGTTYVECDDIDALLAEYRNASVVVTGRLHGALPAISCGTPVVFSQFVSDSRISLLRWLGIKIHNPLDPRLAKLALDYRRGERLPPRQIFARANHLRTAFDEFIVDFHRAIQSGA